MPDRADAGMGHLGTDSTGCVRVTLDDDAVHVEVALARDWRSSHRTEGLGPALFEAFTQAAAVRFAAWAEQPVEPDDAPEDDAAVPHHRLPGSGPHGVTSLLRAWRDLGEFRIRLHEIHSAAATTGSPDQEVTVQVRGAAIVAVHVDRTWSRGAPDSEIERRAGQALTAALAMIADVPQRALEGCPDLREVLAAEGFALPFTVDPPAVDATVPRQPGWITRRPDVPDPRLDW
jgi:hypothetical protein